MSRAVLIGIALSWIATGLYALARPLTFFLAVSGLAMMGPCNVHLVRDVGLALIASGAAIGWGVAKRRRGLAMAGALWPSLHSLFHAQIWGHRGFPLDRVFAFDAALVMAPTAIALMIALRLPNAERL